MVYLFTIFWPAQNITNRFYLSGPRTGRNLEEPRQKYPRIETKVWLVDCVPLFCMHRRYPLIWKLGASLIGGVNTARYTLSAYSPKAPLRPVHHGLGDENYPSFQLSSSKEFFFHNRVMIFLTLLHSFVIFSYLQHHDTQFVMQNNNRKEKLRNMSVVRIQCVYVHHHYHHYHHLPSLPTYPMSLPWQNPIFLHLNIQSMAVFCCHHRPRRSLPKDARKENRICFDAGDKKKHRLRSYLWAT